MKLEFIVVHNPNTFVKPELWADYAIQRGVLGGLGFGAGVRYTGSSFGDTDNTFKTGDFTLFDAVIHYDGRGFRLAVNADNLFDNDHVVYCFADPGCFYGSARSVIGTLRYRW